ncbi:MAG: nitronate monooxygenase [Bdellovibrionota bacterium]|nr:2-nitropropane dioxygenase [Pseudobdellovibrionaceae bacterium]|tara:strand:- start:43094 stop:44077 length:984 start_codon:yes stop_codon:yes gene_type:complete
MRAAKVETRFTKMFNIDYPIISAPMFLVSSVETVVATGQAGGLGAFPAFNYRPIENYAKAIKDIKSQSSAPFAINIIVQSSNKFLEQHIEHALENEVPMIITSLGGPKEVIKRAEGTKTKIFCNVVGLEHAKKVADLGADGLISAGAGAGGHAGETSPFALIPYLKKHVDLPLIAAGSIVDGKGMAAALALGADAIYMGTRFIASKESTVDQDYKNAIINAHPQDIVNTAQVDGFPGNFIRTPLLEKMGIEPGLIESLASHNKKVKRAISLFRAGKSLLAPDKTKVSYKTVYSAGHGVAMIDEILSADEIIQNTVNEYRQLLQNLPK